MILGFGETYPSVVVLMSSLYSSFFALINSPRQSSDWLRSNSEKSFAWIRDFQFLIPQIQKISHCVFCALYYGVCCFKFESDALKPQCIYKKRNSLFGKGCLNFNIIQLKYDEYSKKKPHKHKMIWVNCCQLRDHYFFKYL